MALAELIAVNLDSEEALGTADRILFRLKCHGPQRAVDLSSVLGTTAEAVRQQLVKLAGDGFVRARSLVQGVGRPSQIWELTDRGEERFPNTHAELTSQLITAIQSSLGEGAMDQVLVTRETAMRAHYMQAVRGADESGRAGLRARLEILTRLRSDEGYMAHWIEADDHFMFIENHCPIHQAARHCAGLCRSELALLRAILGGEVQVMRTEHIQNGARRCAYRIELV